MPHRSLEERRSVPRPAGFAKGVGLALATLLLLGGPLSADTPEDLS